MKKENNKKIVWGIGGVIILVAVFYGGTVYGKDHPAARAGAAAFAGRTGGTFNRQGGAALGMGGFTSGSIIAKDDKSITVKLNNTTSNVGQGSKIIFLDGTTKISKEVTGTATDLAVGTQVSVAGTANPDGSINAATVQIRPAMVK